MAFWGDIGAVATTLGVGAVAAAMINKGVAISNLRQAWINNLRLNLAGLFRDTMNLSSYFGQMAVTIQDVPNSLGQLSQQISRKTELMLFALTDEELRTRFESTAQSAMIRLFEIRLSLNKNEADHIKLNQLLEQLSVSRANLDHGKLDEAVNLSQDILKREWEVAKYGVFLPLVRWLKKRRQQILSYRKKS